MVIENKRSMAVQNLGRNCAAVATFFVGELRPPV
jgi:hypothetical protein